ncbi:MAG: sugar phosphate isomerase/epimerase [Chloroflexi bacterium]|nr:sugar phosphate isomerase/epimerase [Chloroflexota bacterium]
MKVALYSVTYAGGWYDGPALSVKQILDRASRVGFDGVEIGCKRPHFSPLDVSESDAVGTAQAARDLGTEIPALAAYNDFSSPVEERREAELLVVLRIIDLAAAMDVGIVRVFAAWPGVSATPAGLSYDTPRRLMDYQLQNADRLDTWMRVRDALAESAHYAARAGVKLALQNHAPVIRGFEDVLDFVREVDSDHLVVSLDCPIMPDQSHAEVRRAVIETGPLIAHSHFGGEFEACENGMPRQRRFDNQRALPNDRAFVGALSEIGYSGFLSYELCHPVLKGHQRTGIEEVHSQVELALRYMRGILAHVTSSEKLRIA